MSQRIFTILVFSCFVIFSGKSASSQPVQQEKKVEMQTAAAINQRFRDCRNCPEMIVVPAGEFMMGENPHSSPKFESSRPDDLVVFRVMPTEAKPYHKVSIPTPFAVGRYPVTFDEWDECVSEGGCRGYQPVASPDEKHLFPVTDVNWDDVESYINWIAKKTGKKYRLLTEAEWEYIARAGSSAYYYWGDAMEDGRINCCGEHPIEKMTKVGALPPNAFGVYDTLGYIWQWTEDCWHATYDRAPTDGSSWEVDGDCKLRVMRGGDYQSPSHIASLSDRNFAPIAYRWYSVGFRVARTIDDASTNVDASHGSE